MGANLVPNGLSRGCKVFCSRSMKHEANEPNVFLDFLERTRDKPKTLVHDREHSFQGIDAYGWNAKEPPNGTSACDRLEPADAGGFRLAK
jgi:hypothetical protein